MPAAVAELRSLVTQTQGSYPSCMPCQYWNKWPRVGKGQGRVEGIILDVEVMTRVHYNSRRSDTWHWAA